MRNRSPLFWVVLIGSFGIFLVFAINVIDVMRQDDDETQIRTAIEEMRQASLKGQSGGVLEWMSKKFELPAPYGDKTVRPLAEVSSFIRNAEIQTLEVKVDTVEVSGDVAIANCTINTDVTYQSFPFKYNGPVQIEFRKETHRRLFIIPEKKWQVVSFGPLDTSSYQMGF